MAESNSEERPLRDEIARLNKIVEVLMDRAERSTNVQGSAYSLFQTTIMLEEKVRQRTAELEAALRENVAITEALRNSEAMFRGLVSQSLVGIAMVEEATFIYANQRFAEIFGYADADEVLSIPPVDTVAETDRELVAEHERRRQNGQCGHFEYVFKGIRKDRSLIDVECHSSTIQVGGKCVVVCLVSDITERVRAGQELQALQVQLREQAIRDPLTGLYNRRYLSEFFDRELSRARRRGISLSIVLGDIDLFKAVNDTYGHLGGDEVLRNFGELLRRSYRSSDVCFRYGGEEFLAVLPDVATRCASKRTEELRLALASSVTVVGASTIRVTASFGIATFPQDGDSFHQLLAAADKALYAAKHSGRNQVKSYSAETSGDPAC